MEIFPRFSIYSTTTEVHINKENTLLSDYKCGVLLLATATAHYQTSDLSVVTAPRIYRASAGYYTNI